MVDTNVLQRGPKCYFRVSEIDIQHDVEILGFICAYKNGGCESNIDNWLRKCRQLYYGLSKCGMVYPGATSEVKCLPLEVSLQASNSLWINEYEH